MAIEKPIMLDETGQKIAEVLQKISEKSQIADTVISDSYDASKAYSVGEYCIHDNKLYKCETATTAGEAWNEDYWKETNVITAADDKIALLGTGEYSLVNFVDDKATLNSNDDYLHVYLAAGGTYIFSGDTTYKSFRSAKDNNTTLSSASNTKDDVSYSPETSGIYCLRWYKTVSDEALQSLKLRCSTVGGALHHLSETSRYLNSNLARLEAVVATKSALVPTGTQIYSGSDLNDIKYTAVGSYYCSAVVDGKTLSNAPEGTAFMMSVYNPLSKDTGQINGQWQYRLQEIFTYDAKHKYVRMVSSDSSSTVSYGSWKTEF